MPDVKLGTRHECSECATKFYDLGKSKAACPKCGHEVSRKAEPTSRRKKKAAPAAPEPEVSTKANAEVSAEVKAKANAKDNAKDNAEAKAKANAKDSADEAATPTESTDLGDQDDDFELEDLDDSDDEDLDV